MFYSAEASKTFVIHSNSMIHIAGLLRRMLLTLTHTYNLTKELWARFTTQWHRTRTLLPSRHTGRCIKRTIAYVSISCDPTA